jgi:hypothetical protein
MNEKIKYAAYGSFIALGAVALVVALLWKPVIQPQLVATSTAAGKGALGGFLSSLGINV